jgi:hypothetical protein
MPALGGDSARSRFAFDVEPIDLLGVEAEMISDARVLGQWLRIGLSAPDPVLHRQVSDYGEKA